MTDYENINMEIAEYFTFLDMLRESGVTNMYGASPYLEQEFNMKKLDARKVLSAWMQTFDDASADERAEKAINEGLL